MPGGLSLTWTYRHIAIPSGPYDGRCGMADAVNPARAVEAHRVPTSHHFDIALSPCGAIKCKVPLARERSVFIIKREETFLCDKLG